MKTSAAVPFLITVLFAVTVLAESPEGERDVHEIPRLSSPPVIDGVVEEAEWSEALPVSVPYEFKPGDNIPAIVDTDCFLAYDSKAVYLACRAHDPDPAAIRAHLTDRDSAWRDDYLGVFFDTYNDQTRAFGFMVNPLGVQSDVIRNDAGTGKDYDSSWDAIWRSKGRITSQGYEVELAIPYTSLRFQRTDGPQTWGFYVVRTYPRSVEHELSSSPIDRNRSCMVCQAKKIHGFDGADPGKNLELNPTITAADVAGEEDLESSFRGREDGVQLGLTALWGVTPNLTLTGTVNPDFSQVEADKAQVRVNRQFAIFFEEKRPFFLEGADFLETYLRPVHTRTVINPNWGAKLTGKVGRGAIGAFVAEDAVTAILIPGSERSVFVPVDAPSLDAVARYRWDLGAASNVGAIYTGRQGENRYSNHVAGFDGLFRVSPSDTIKVQALGSQTEYPDEIAADYDQPSGRFRDGAYLAVYDHRTRNWWWGGGFMDVGKGFRADLGFVPRVNYRQVQGVVERAWWGDADEWYSKLNLGAYYYYEEDQDGFVLHRGGMVYGGFDGPLQSKVDYKLAVRTRGYAGAQFDEVSHMVESRVRPSGAYDLELFLQYGDDIDYEHVRPGIGLQVRPEFDLRIGRHLELSFAYHYESLDVAAGRLYEVGLSDIGAVYQFTARAFVRAIVQHQNLRRNPDLYERDVDAKTEALFAELLFSYKLNPRTVLFAGYTDRHRGTEMENLVQLNRAVFLKVGYAFVW